MVKDITYFPKSNNTYLVPDICHWSAGVVDNLVTDFSNNNVIANLDSLFSRVCRGKRQGASEKVKFVGENRGDIGDCQLFYAGG